MTRKFLAMAMIWALLQSSFAQTTRTSATQEGNNTLTGTNLIKNLNGEINCGQYATIDACYAAIATGGAGRIPDNTAMTTSSGLTIAKSVTIRGANRDTSIIQATAAVVLITGSGTVGNVLFENLTFDCNNLGTFGFKVADYDGVTVNWSDGQYSFKNVVFKNCTDRAMSMGRSFFFLTLEDVRFTNNNGGVFCDRYCELRGKNLFFYDPRDGATNAQLHLVASSNTEIRGAAFQLSSSTSTAEDILIAGPTDGNDGNILLDHLKLGPEGENAARFKIRIAGDPSHEILNLRITNSDFGCVSSAQTAIKLETPIGRSVIANPTVSECGTFINDAQNLFTNTANGANLIVNPTYYSATTTVPIWVTNGGRGFRVINDPFAGFVSAAKWQPRTTETPVLLNRLGRSRTFGSWTNNGAVTITTGQTDNHNGTGATLLTRSANASQNLTLAIDTTGMGNTAVYSCEFKAGTGSTVLMAVEDTSDSALHEERLFKLQSYWDRYGFAVGGLNAAHTLKVKIYPAEGPSAAAGDTILVDACQVDDHGGDYLNSDGGSATTDTTAGSVKNRGFKIGMTGTTVQAFWSVTSVIDFGSISANTCSDSSGITVTGSGTGDLARTSAPSTLGSAGVQYTAYVSAADTVKVHACNVTTGAIDPASATFRIGVTHF